MLDNHSSFVAHLLLFFEMDYREMSCCANTFSKCSETDSCLWFDGLHSVLQASFIKRSREQNIE